MNDFFQFVHSFGNKLLNRSMGDLFGEEFLDSVIFLNIEDNLI